MKVLLLIALMLLLHFSLNICRLLLTLRYYKKLKNKSPHLSRYIPFVARLFGKAGTDATLASTMYRGKKHSFLLGKSDYEWIVDNTFNLTIATYQFRAIQTFNPLYWIELPSRIRESYSKAFPNFPQKVFSLLFWLTSAFAGYIVEKVLDRFLPNIVLIIESILK